MLKHLRFLTMMLCLAAFHGVWAADKTVTIDLTAQGWANAQDVTSVQDASGAVTVTFDKGSGVNAPKYYTTGTAVRIYGGSSIVISLAEGSTEKISQIVYTFSGASYAPTNTATVNIGNITPGAITTWSGSASSVSISRPSGSGHWRLQKVEVTFGTEDATHVDAPSISGNEDFVGSQQITITGPANSTIYYGIDLAADDLSDAPGEYTGKGEDGTGVAQLTLDATHTVVAFAKVGENKSAVVSKTFTLQQPTDKTIADLHGMTEDQAFINLKLTNAKVVYVDGKNVYVREGDKAVLFYNTNLELPLNSTLNGSVICDYDNYYGVIEVKDNDATNLEKVTVTEATTTTLDPTVTTVGDVLQLKNISDLVRLNGVTITAEGEGTSAKYYANSGTDKIELYRNDSAIKNLAGDGNTYNLIAGFNNINQGTPRLKPFCVAVPVTVGATGYSTLYYGNLALTVPEGATAFTYKVVSGKLENSRSFEAGKNLSAGMAVVINANPGNYDFLSTTNTGNSDSENMLLGTDTETQLEADAGSYFYWLTTNKAGDTASVGFYWGNADGSAFTNGAHKAYLKAPKEATSGAKVFLFSGETTGINTIGATEKTANEAVYNLAGQRVDDNYKGVVIVNGKKVIKK